MTQGWIRMHRKIKEHWIFREKREFSKFEAWFDMLTEANHQDNKFLLGNEVINVNRGSFITSELKLIDRWGWSKTKLRSFLKLLESEDMIIKVSDRKKTTITICNYCIYQDFQTTKEPQKNHEKTSENREHMSFDTEHLQHDDKKETAENPIVPMNEQILETSDKPQGNHEQTIKRLSADTNNNENNDNNLINNDDEDNKVTTLTPEKIVKTVENKYLQRRSKGFDLSPKDEAAIKEIVGYGIPLEDILRLIDARFDTYEPKHPRDRIKTFDYVAEYICHEYYAEQEKKTFAVIQGGVQNATNQQQHAILARKNRTGQTELASKPRSAADTIRARRASKNV